MQAPEPTTRTSIESVIDARACGHGRVQRDCRSFAVLRSIMLKAVIFDIDGTLIDSVDLHARSWVDAFARFGAEVRLEDVRGHIGEGADRLIPSFVPGISESKRKQIEGYRSALFKR